MKLKGIYTERPAIFQLFLLLSLILVGTILTGIIGMIPVGLNIDITQNANALRLYQFVSTVLTFLLPSILVAYVCSNNFSEYLSISRLPNLKVLLITFVSMFLLSPIITLTGLLNKSMKLPAVLEPLEKWMQSMEATAEQATELLLSGTDWVSILLNLLVIAVTAAVTEEFLFRGTLQRIIGKWTPKPHLIIWTVAIIFSAIHMQFYGFIPRLLLGAYFGYLLYWSKNLWLPVFAHFTNNAVAVIGMSNENLKDNMFISGEIPDAEIISFTFPALISFAFFFICIVYLRKSLTDKA